METPKKLSANDTIIKLVNNMIYDRKDLFYKEAEAYKETLSASGDTYRRLHRLLLEKPKTYELKALPHDINNLVTIPTDSTNDNVFLNNSIKELLDELLIEWGNKDKYREHKIKVRNKLLFYGPTGNGKTTIARHIAELTNLPFVEINGDMLIKSTVGSTSQNINNLFNKLNMPCVLFYDEFDSVASKRSNGDKSGAETENNRMVNSLLINIEKLHEDIIFIAATNIADKMDEAILRRFDIKHEIVNPSIEQKCKFAGQLEKYYNITGWDVVSEDQLKELSSYHDIKQHYVNLTRKRILENIKENLSV